jgi:hypothetical protein
VKLCGAAIGQGGRCVAQGASSITPFESFTGWADHERRLPPQGGHPAAAAGHRAEPRPHRDDPRGRFQRLLACQDHDAWQLVGLSGRREQLPSKYDLQEKCLCTCVTNSLYICGVSHVCDTSVGKFSFSAQSMVYNYYSSTTNGDVNVLACERARSALFVQLHAGTRQAHLFDFYKMQRGLKNAAYSAAHMFVY